MKVNIGPYSDEGGTSMTNEWNVTRLNLRNYKEK